MFEASILLLRSCCRRRCNVM